MDLFLYSLSSFLWISRWILKKFSSWLPHHQVWVWFDREWLWIGLVQLCPIFLFPMLPLVDHFPLPNYEEEGQPAGSVQHYPLMETELFWGRNVHIPIVLHASEESAGLCCGTQPKGVPCGGFWEKVDSVVAVTTVRQQDKFLANTSHLLLRSQREESWGSRHKHKYYIEGSSIVFPCCNIV